MRKIVKIGLVLLAVATVAFAPNREPALPEPGARRVVATVFGVKL